MRYAETLSAGCFLDKSAFLLSHGADLGLECAEVKALNDYQGTSGFRLF